ncbi:hypothetical protein [Kutzneria buriramensis]|uniref:Uncharacterized protein n=1 Tax=Kutzneria buriramensis TaxID=1045776 RepID=A0A3E0HYZ5_9PSEU|nr:hypothetical protein [Kutzneria buriramensis]REH51694.1 hypothetical protein BCF44_103143 [Kutzneria buriramensis]
MPQQNADQNPAEAGDSTPAADETVVRPNRAERRHKGKAQPKTNGVAYNPHVKTASTGHQRQYSNRRSGG